MTNSYTTKVTLTDKAVIVESIVGNQQLIDTTVRGVNENIAVAEFCLRHKQQADVILQTDTPRNIEARMQVDMKTHITRDIYGSKV